MVRKLSLVLLAACSMPALADVNIYSARQENLIKPILDTFTERTGVKVNLVTGAADELIQRLTLEGANSPADLLIAEDVGRLYRAKQAGVLQAVKSSTINDIIPAQYRDSEGFWFGLSLRSRVIIYDKARVNPADLSTYADLADPKWDNKICVRSSSNIYNQSLVASMVSRNGVAATEEWVTGLVANFARNPQGGDREQISAVAAGQCELAISNTYYYGGMLNSTNAAERTAAQAVAVFFPDQNGNGAHMNVSGAAVTRAARNVDEAVQLLEFLAGEEAQAWYAEVNNEFPVRSDVAASEVLQSWGTFKADNIALEQLGIHNAEAVRLMDRAGWQ
ncbi:MAG: Fe(3+) ABC transporter substrate-binding protein [Gammaproteobacteria bacterium]|nr:Fe(3+) ABC transporter substrate-binding protein [Gammaproteobacteria bacterium]MDP2348563.1 Fe(3+) ABC transporter substrate-binding protein [Gammaproteobacteria bacterium]